MVRVWTLLFITALAACATPDATPTTEPSSAPPGPVAEADDCTSWSALRAGIPPSIKTPLVDDAQAFIRGFNAEPPPSDVVAEEVHLWHRKSYDGEHDVAIIFFTHDGCVLEPAALPWSDAERLIGLEI